MSPPPTKFVRGEDPSLVIVSPPSPPPRIEPSKSATPASGSAASLPPLLISPVPVSTIPHPPPIAHPAPTAAPVLAATAPSKAPEKVVDIRSLPRVNRDRLFETIVSPLLDSLKGMLEALIVADYFVTENQEVTTNSPRQQALERMFIFIKNECRHIDNPDDFPAAIKALPFFSEFLRTLEIIKRGAAIEALKGFEIFLQEWNRIINHRRPFWAISGWLYTADSACDLKKVIINTNGRIKIGTLEINIEEIIKTSMEMGDAEKNKAITNKELKIQVEKQDAEKRDKVLSVVKEQLPKYMLFMKDCYDALIHPFYNGLRQALWKTPPFRDLFFKKCMNAVHKQYIPHFKTLVQRKNTSDEEAVASIKDYFSAIEMEMRRLLSEEKAKRKKR